MWSLSLSSQSLKPLCVLYKTDLSKKIKSQKLYNTKKQNIIVILDTWIQFYQLFSPAHLQRPQWFLSMGNWAIRVALRFYLHLNLLHDELVWNCDKPNKTISLLMLTCIISQLSMMRNEPQSEKSMISFF